MMPNYTLFKYLSGLWINLVWNCLDAMSVITGSKESLPRRRIGRVRRVKRLGYIIPVEGGGAAGKGEGED